MMDKFLDKLSPYNFLNNLIPGATFCYLLKLFYGLNLQVEDIVANLLFFYFCGIVISRIGSILIERFLKKTKFIRFANYPLFVQACIVDPKIDVLSETNNMYRSLTALFLVITLVGLYLLIWVEFSRISILALSAALCLLFLLSYKKQTAYIKDRVETICNTREDVK